MKLKVAFALLITFFSLYLVSQNIPIQQVGPTKDGGFLLNSGWVIHPAGGRLDVDTFPMKGCCVAGWPISARPEWRLHWPPRLA